MQRTLERLRDLGSRVWLALGLVALVAVFGLATPARAEDPAVPDDAPIESPEPGDPGDPGDPDAPDTPENPGDPDAPDDSGDPDNPDGPGADADYVRRNLDRAIGAVAGAYGLVNDGGYGSTGFAAYLASLRNAVAVFFDGDATGGELRDAIDGLLTATVPLAGRDDLHLALADLDAYLDQLELAVPAVVGGEDVGGFEETAWNAFVARYGAARDLAGTATVGGVGEVYDAYEALVDAFGDLIVGASSTQSSLYLLTIQGRGSIADLEAISTPESFAAFEGALEDATALFDPEAAPTEEEYRSAYDALLSAQDSLEPTEGYQESAPVRTGLLALCRAINVALAGEGIDFPPMGGESARAFNDSFANAWALGDDLDEGRTELQFAGMDLVQSLFLVDLDQTTGNGPWAHQLLRLANAVADALILDGNPGFADDDWHGVELANRAASRVLGRYTGGDEDALYSQALQALTDLREALSACFGRTDFTEIHRLYNPYSHEHLYSARADEVSTLTELGWSYEGIAWYAPADAGEQVIRLYNPYTSDHYYLAEGNATELDTLLAIGWLRDEGAGWLSPGTSAYPVYQLYNPYELRNTHVWTTDANESRELRELGWEENLIPFYAAYSTR